MKHGLILLLASFILCCSLNSVAAHNHLIWPVPRDPRAFYENDNNCENGNGNFPGGQTFQRGQTITPRWSFNNHHGGFIRFSLVPKGQENERGIFGRTENILAMACHTKNCGGPGVRFDPGDTIPCSTPVTIPNHLKDGNYVLQWITYSMFGSQGILEKGLPNYLSCANVKIQGGPLDENRRPGKCSFTWSGGERGYHLLGGNRGAAPDTCAYFMRNNVGRSQETVVVGKHFMKAGGRPIEVEYCLKNGGLNQWSNGGSAPAPAPAPVSDNKGGAQPTPGKNGGGQDCERMVTAIAGDRCSTIAQRYGSTMEKVRDMNSFVNCKDIWAGTTLCI